MSEYRCITGSVSFVRATGKVRRVGVKLANQVGELNTVTVFDMTTPINVGDFFYAEGEYTQETGKNREGRDVVFKNLKGSTFVVFPAGKKNQGGDDDVDF